MDQVPQAPQVPQPEPQPQAVIPSPKKPLPIKKIILGLMLILIPIFLALAYLNILPFNLISSKQKPAQITTQVSLQPFPTPIPEKLVISCPVPKEFCNKGKIIDAGENFYGMHFTLPLDIPLLTVFSGQLSDKPQVEERPKDQPLLYLRDTKGAEAIYSYFGSNSNITTDTYSPGKEIGKIGQGQFPSVASFGGSNFLFSLKKDGQFVKFSLDNQ